MTGPFPLSRLTPALNTQPRPLFYPPTRTEDGGERVAFLDIEERHLWVEYPDGRIKELPWPKGWPGWVSREFVMMKGFRVVE